MTDVTLSGEAHSSLRARATLDSRYSFGPQFLCAAGHQTRLAFDVERKEVAQVTDEDRIAHRGFVVGALLQACAALETEAWEIVHYGPGYHGGSNATDDSAQRFLSPLAELVDRGKTLSRYATILHLLKKPPLERGKHPWQDAELVVKLRNAIIHHKSQWGKELKRDALFRALQQKAHPHPPFVPPDGVNFFPHHCLSASCAAWAVEACVAFIEAFYHNLAVPSPLAPYAGRIRARP